MQLRASTAERLVLQEAGVARARWVIPNALVCGLCVVVLCLSVCVCIPMSWTSSSCSPIRVASSVWIPCSPTMSLREEENRGRRMEAGRVGWQEGIWQDTFINKYGTSH